MFGNHFYNETIRRYVAVFGTLFNDIQIERRNSEGVVHSKMKVPINYAPVQKILARLEGDPDLSAPAMSLPRMSFEITGMNYAPERKVSSTLRYRGGSVADANSLVTRTVPAPYDIEFQLNIMTKYNEDGTRILEQILPFFKPDVTPSVKLLDDLELYLDIPIILNSTSTEDSYEGDFQTRRALIHTMSFTLRGYFFGPNTSKKMIKFAKANITQPMTATTPSEFVSAQPGLTANGQPTTSISETVDYGNINIDDNWDYVVVVDDADE